MFAALLVAIVGMRVEVLKLGTRVGTQIAQASALQSSNALLRSDVSDLSGDQRIQRLAEKLGMVMPGPMDIHFVSVRAGGHVQAAIKAVRAPSPASFLSGLAAERRADQTSTERAAETSAVGVLADTVTGYYESTAPTGATGAGNASTSGASGALGATTGSGAGATTATGTAAGAAGASAAAGAVSSHSAAATSTSATVQAASAQTSATASPGSVPDATEVAPPPASVPSSTATAAGSGSPTGTTTGGTSLNG